MACAVDEVPVGFACNGTELIGLLHVPAPSPELGVVIVVGGPQYRVGSHRLFVLLARELASEGAGVLRFDCRGMGDSAGNFPGFEGIAPDIAAAVDFMVRRLPSIRHIILWGLCDAVSAICEHANRDPRISGIVMVNPWVRTEGGHARATLKHYYINRLVQGAFARKVLRGEFNLVRSLRDLLGNIVLGFQKSAVIKSIEGSRRSGTLAGNMAEDLRRYHGRILLIMSGRDITAREFDDTVHQSGAWRSILRHRSATRYDLAEADHTFSRRDWRNQLSEWTWRWLKSFE